jgi:hypothetical protein
MTIKILVQCSSCKGTGLYVGLSEMDGCAVVCSRCKGTGEMTLEYEYFTGLKHREGVRRVFKSSFGYVHSAEDSEGIEFSKGGCTYDEWIAGEKPRPVKTLYCPLAWENQELANKDHPKHSLYMGRCSYGIDFGRSISDCNYFKQKSECWGIYDGTLKYKFLKGDDHERNF